MRSWHESVVKHKFRARDELFAPLFALFRDALRENCLNALGSLQIKSGTELIWSFDHTEFTESESVEILACISWSASGMRLRSTPAMCAILTFWFQTLVMAPSGKEHDMWNSVELCGLWLPHVAQVWRRHHTFRLRRSKLGISSPVIQSIIAQTNSHQMCLATTHTVSAWTWRENVYIAPLGEDQEVPKQVDHHRNSFLIFLHLHLFSGRKGWHIYFYILCSISTPDADAIQLLRTQAEHGSAQQKMTEHALE